LVVNMALPGTGLGLRGSGIRGDAPRIASETLAPRLRQRVPPHFGVYLENEFGTGLRTAEPLFIAWEVTWGRDGGDTIATIRSTPSFQRIKSNGQAVTEDLHYLQALIHPDKRVTIMHSPAGFPATVLFQGFPQLATIGWNENEQSFSVQCLSEGNEILRHDPLCQITGPRRLRDPLETFLPGTTPIHVVEAELLTFNPKGLGNRSKEWYALPIDGVEHRIHLFTDAGAPWGRLWTAAQALRYLAFFGVLRPDYPAPQTLNHKVNVRDFLRDTAALVDLAYNPEQSDKLARLLSAPLPETQVGSCNLEEAVQLVCKQAGIHYEIPIRNTASAGAILEHYLRVYASLNDALEAEEGRSPDLFTINPRVFDVPREAPFTSLSGRSDAAVAVANRAQRATLTADLRGINAPIVLGGRKLYEVTLLLRPGWIPLFEYQLDNLSTQPLRDAALTAWEERLEDPFEGENGVPDSVYHARHPEHYTVADAGRLWIFPDDETYYAAVSGGAFLYARLGWPKEMYSPFFERSPSRPNVLVSSYLGGGILDEQGINDASNWVARRRLFLDTIARIGGTEARPAIVRLNYNAVSVPSAALDIPERFLSSLNAAGWFQYTGAVQVLPDRAGVLLTEANLFKSPELSGDPDGDPDHRYLEALIAGTLCVSVTCTIEGDARLGQRPLANNSPNTRRTAKVVDTGFEQFQSNNRRGQNSFLRTQPVGDDPTYEDRDDAEKLSDFAESAARELARMAISGPIDVFYIDTGFRLGDTFSGCSGLGIVFGAYPEVESIEFHYDPQGGYRTTLHLTDVRHSPEVGAEN
jgi:hypothetical protein